MYKALLLLCLLFFSCKIGSAQDIDEMEISMKQTVNFLASDSLQGRKSGSENERIAAEYIYNQLFKAGVTMLSPQSGSTFFVVKSAGDTLKSSNIIGVVEGYDPTLRNEYIVIGAHYDHLGFNIVNINGKQETQIYNGADDNASGVAVLLELAKYIQSNKFLFKRSVIFAFFGGEEIGMTGSWNFVNNSFTEINNVIMMVNIDMVGRNSGNGMNIFTMESNSEIRSSLEAISSRPASFLIPKISTTNYFPSDHLSFYSKGIPIVLFTSGLHADYHSINDTPDKLDYNQMAHLVEYISAFTQHISDLDQRPAPLKLNPDTPSKDFDASDASEGSEKIYTQFDVDKRAQFLHSDERQFLSKWVYKYLKYPESAIKEGITGRVIVEFTVDKNGNVKDVTIVKGVSESIDNEVVKVVSASPKWKPAEFNGEKVSVRVSVPIDFRLTKSNRVTIKK